MADHIDVLDELKGEKTPFLNDEDNLSDDEELGRSPTVRPRTIPMLFGFALGTIVGVAVTAILLSVWTTQPTLAYTPAKDALIPERQPLRSIDHKKTGLFSGIPNTAQTEAWEELLQPVMIKAGESEVVQAGDNPEDSVQLQAGGYLASLSVYHDLHCLRRIRFWMYRDVFYPNITEAELDYEHDHIEHCLEALRVSTMCAGDASMYTFKWDARGQKVVSKSGGERSCIQWEGLDNWARDRAVGFHAGVIPA